METADLTAPMFTNEDAARAQFEKLRWPGGEPICHHCGTVGDAAPVKGKSHRPGLYYCRSCEKTFTATMGTVYEDSHIPLHKWLLATHLMNASKKGIAALQLQRMLGLGSYRSAWFMAMRIREGMRAAGTLPPMGGAGGIVEADETYFGRDSNAPKTTTKSKFHAHKDRRPKRAVVALVERGGKARVFHVARADKETVAATRTPAGKVIMPSTAVLRRCPLIRRASPRR